MLISAETKNNQSLLGSTDSNMHSSVLTIENKYDLEKQHKCGKCLKCFAKLILAVDLMFGAIFVWIYIASIVCKVTGKR